MILVFLFFNAKLVLQYNAWIPPIQVGHLQAVISGYDEHYSSNCHRAPKTLSWLLLNWRPAEEFFCHCTSPLHGNGRSNQDKKASLWQLENRHAKKSVPRSIHSLAFDKVEQIDELCGESWRQGETKAEVKQECNFMLSSFLAIFNRGAFREREYESIQEELVGGQIIFRVKSCEN